MFGTLYFYKSAASLSLTVQHNIKIVKIMEMVVCRSLFSLLFIPSKLKTKDNLRREKENKE